VQSLAHGIALLNFKTWKQPPSSEILGYTHKPKEKMFFYLFYLSPPSGVQHVALFQPQHHIVYI